jgi:ketosteroid isomerase-like protein
LDRPSNRTTRLTGSALRRRVSDIVAYRMSGQIDRMMRYFSENVVLHYTCTKDGIFRPTTLWGIDAFRQNIRHSDENYAPVDSEILDIIVDGAHTVVRWRSRWRFHGSGKIYTMDMAHFLYWEGGLVVEMYEFLDVHGPAIPRGACAPLTFDNLLTPRPAGLDRDEIEKRTRLLGDYMKRRDLAGIREICSPDIICEFIGDRSRIPYAGRHIGIEALISITRTIAIDFSQEQSAISEIVVEDARVAIRRRVHWRHIGTGRTGYVDLANFLRFDDGKIIEIIEYRDSVTLIEMQGGL